jgi:hypothetical protein
MMPARWIDSQLLEGVRTVDTSYGPLPVVDTWRDCRHTKTGWTGVNDKGERVNMSYRPEERAYGPARMPDEDHVVLVRDAVGSEPRDVAGFTPVGAVLIERAARGKAKRKPLTVVKG